MAIILSVRVLACVNIAVCAIFLRWMLEWVKYGREH